MKRTFRIIITGIFCMVLLGSIAIADIDLSTMSAEELNLLISQAREALKALEPETDNNNVLYERNGQAIVSISSIEANESYGQIQLNLLMINDKDSELSFLFDKVIINGWEVKSSYGDVFISAHAKSRAGYVTIRDIYNLSDTSSLNEIESIEVYARMHYDNEYLTMRYLMTYDEDIGLKILEREEIQGW